MSSKKARVKTAAKRGGANPDPKENCVTKPSFGTRSTLLRYIEPEHRLSGNYIDSAAFFADPGPPREEYLSVNSLEVEKVKDIASRFKAKRPAGGDVAVGMFTVGACNMAARDALVDVRTHDELIWSFPENGNLSAAYLAHCNSSNPSHCGIEFVRILDDLAEHRFASRMTRHRYHLFDGK